MTKEMNRKLTDGEVEKAWCWLHMNINKEAIALHFKLSIASLNRQMGIKVDPLKEALNRMGKTI